MKFNLTFIKKFIKNNDNFLIAVNKYFLIFYKLIKKIKVSVFKIYFLK